MIEPVESICYPVTTGQSQLVLANLDPGETDMIYKSAIRLESRPCFWLRQRRDRSEEKGKN